MEMNDMTIILEWVINENIHNQVKLATIKDNVGER